MYDRWYDEDVDVMYINFVNAHPSLGYPIAPGVIVFRDEIDGSVTGITIINFCKRFIDRSLWTLPIPPEIDLKRMDFSDIPQCMNDSYC